ncbi:MAG TPA: isoprenylcysteine carboxylmethyltransferase family protein [Phycisphaerae bacterium]|nr:isoprenylcysteine carboxylmethyltransferase family protein [Phycisphaerae bacterium]
MGDSTNSDTTGTQQSDMAAGIRKWAIKNVVFLLLLPILLYASSGRADWVMGWVLVGICAGYLLATAVLILPKWPDLIAERAGMQKGAKKWDLAIVSAAAVWLPMASWVVAGLDLRFGWPPAIPWWCQWVAAGAVATALAAAFWAMASNRFFSGVVRIQRDRGHVVQTGGPYRYVRHPAYAGVILYTMAIPVMLGSAWAMIPAGVASVLFVVRTALEDRTLHRELDGYADYAARVRYRLLPGVW